MASTLFISMPARGMIHTKPDWVSEALPFALFSIEGQLLEQGEKTLADLKKLAIDVRQLSLLIAASDVSLLTTKVPPMSPSKFKAALPNLLEEQITGDPSSVVLVASPVVGGESTVAVADREWVEQLAVIVKDWPVRKIAAYPAQLALQMTVDNEHVSAIVENRDECASLTLRQGVSQGLGFDLASADHEDVIRTITLLAPEKQIVLYVANNEKDRYEALISAQKKDVEITILPLSWLERIGGVNAQTPDLMSEVSAIHKPAIDWNLWRWPLRLVAMILLVNIIALNLEWFNLKRTAKSLNDVLVATYKTSFPKETTILNPLAQMRQKVNLTKKMAGQFAPDDFVVLASEFAQVWDRVVVGRAASVMSVDYKDHGLEVRVKSLSTIPMDQLKLALSERSLRLTTTSDGVLHITQSEVK